MFAGGVISSASPCALATVPLVVGYVGGQTQGDRRRAFGYSLAFVFGLATTFTTLGAAAALLLGLFLAWSPAPARRRCWWPCWAWWPPRARWFTALRCCLPMPWAHCMLMLAAGTFTGLVQAWAQSRGLMAFSRYLRQVLGVMLVAAGGYLLWQA